MGAIQLREGLWSVGVLNPSLRVFDIVMEARYGTSYNAYLLTGPKNVLIEAVHADYWDEFAANLRQVLDGAAVDYLILNHTEPDHSGSVAKLLEAYPGLQICCTAPAKKHLTDITNRADLPIRVVKAGDTLEVGNRTLEFIPAPMLHWADSMFTWDRAGKTLFTCDFLGAHYCEPTMRDTGIHEKPAYEGEFYHYYRCIFGPFPAYVQAGLDKLPEAELICPSHGPCLTERISWAKDLYRKWSTPKAKDKPTACVIYASAYGNTRRMAETAARALVEDGFAVMSCDVNRDDLFTCAQAANEADVLLVGAPTINKDAPKPVWDVLSSLDAVNTKGRAAAAFGDYGWSGEAAGMLQARLAQMKFSVPEAPFKVQFTPTEEDLEQLRSWVRGAAALREGATQPAAPAKAARYVCKLCGYVYDPEKGDPTQGIAPGTPFETLPDTWRCPLCKVGKDMFQKEA